MNAPRFATMLAATGLALGALTLAAPAASAEPQKPIKESTIKSECKSAGGTYGTTTFEKGGNYSTCRYKDIDGKVHVDDYLGGKYLGTTDL